MVPAIRHGCLQVKRSLGDFDPTDPNKEELRLLQSTERFADLLTGRLAAATMTIMMTVIKRND